MPKPDSQSAERHAGQSAGGGMICPECLGIKPREYILLFRRMCPVCNGSGIASCCDVAGSPGTAEPVPTHPALAGPESHIAAASCPCGPVEDEPGVWVHRKGCDGGRGLRQVAGMIQTQQVLDRTKPYGSRGIAWVAECVVDGKPYTVRSRSGAPYALARALIADGVPDQAMVVTSDGLVGETRYRSIHAMAGKTVMESATQPVRLGIYRPYAG